MRILIDGEQIKIQNFVEYLIETYAENGKTYQFEILIDDRFDKKVLENKENSLKDNILVMHNDGFDILGQEYKSDLERFKERISEILDKESIVDGFTSDDFDNQLVHYKIRFLENESEHHFEFSYINLTD